MRSLGAQGGRRFLVKQGHASAICELDLVGLDEFITVLSATTQTTWRCWTPYANGMVTIRFNGFPCCFVRFRIGGFVPPGELP